MFSNLYRFAHRQARSLKKRIGPRDFVSATSRGMPDIAEDDVRIMEAVRAYTMVNVSRLYAFIAATRYAVQSQIPGAIVECGVWKGGATVASIKTVQALGRTDRDFYLYDTFEGMTCPTEHDRSDSGESAILTFKRRQIAEDSSDWCRADLEHVKRDVLATGYPPGRIHFVKGKVEETIPGFVPEKIAVLRLDTDWYESTKHELEHLYPRLSRGGVLLIDDYGHWQGSRKAVDEYFAGQDTPILLHRTDSSGRAGVKIAA